MAERHEARRPLEGVKVLDLSRILAGPFCGQILADLGADVVKVERPGVGDDTRSWGPPFLGDDGPSAYYLSANRGKRSITIDLSRHEGRELLERLIARSDVLIENFRTETLEKLGLTGEQLERLNPQLVACSISGFGRSGPMRNVPGYDFVVQGSSGLMSITGEPEGPPMKVGVAISDVLTGLYAAVSILAGLAGRGPDDAGRWFDLSLADCTLASLVNVAQAALVTGERPRRYGNAHPHIVPYQMFATRDGYLILAVGNDAQWRRFCGAAGRAAWADDPRFATNAARVKHRELLVRQLERLMATRSTAEWQTLLDAADVPHGHVAHVDEALTSEQARAREMVIECEDRRGRTLRLLGSPIHWRDRPAQRPLPPPELGEHTETVLREWLDCDAPSIERLRASGALG